VVCRLIEPRGQGGTFEESVDSASGRQDLDLQRRDRRLQLVLARTPQRIIGVPYLAAAWLPSPIPNSCSPP
jgi:hypothetical protein